MDLVFAIQDTNRSNIKFIDGIGTDSIDLNPRICAIYFGTKSGDLKQQLVSDSLIILRDSPTMEEPFVGFKINNKGVLQVSYSFWTSAGSWVMSNHTYEFHFTGNAFTLIGYHSNEVNRSSGNIITSNINFLTQKIKVSKGKISEADPYSVICRPFNLEIPITIRSIRKPFDSEFEGIHL